MHVSMTVALERLHAALDRAGAPVSGRLRPGRPVDEILDTVRRATGLELPPQAVAWFAWQDGVEPHDPAMAPHSLRHWEPHGVRDAIDHYQSWLRLAGRTSPSSPREVVDAWDTRWFPIATDLGGYPLMVVCGGQADGQVVLVHYQDPHLVGHIYPSIHFVIEAWTSFLEEGVWSCDTGGWRWTTSVSPLLEVGDPRFGLA